eukprot:52444-Eustigmatos_ZCMA.PRE.1
MDKPPGDGRSLPASVGRWVARRGGRLPRQWGCRYAKLLGGVGAVYTIGVAQGTACRATVLGANH